MNFADDIVGVAPNAGYPELVHERTVYIQNPDYFAEKMQEIYRLGVKILGGMLWHNSNPYWKNGRTDSAGFGYMFCQTPFTTKPMIIPEKKTSDGFGEKMKKGQFIVAVELDPPFNADSELMMKNAWICKDHGVDVITIADSPMGRARVDSIMIAAKIKEKWNRSDSHICCRDKNINALKAALLAGYMENIRNILAITGDPVAIADKNDIKSVFNLNSFKLIELISIMNKEVFADDPINIGGALNLNGSNHEGELSRMVKKIDMGAAFFLTQPIFDDAGISALPQIKQQENSKVLGGIMPLVSYRNAQFLNNEVPGIRIPEKILNRLTGIWKKKKLKTWE